MQDIENHHLLALAVKAREKQVNPSIDLLQNNLLTFFTIVLLFGEFYEPCVQSSWNLSDVLISLRKKQSSRFVLLLLVIFIILNLVIFIIIGSICIPHKSWHVFTMLMILIQPTTNLQIKYKIISTMVFKF